jgi:hypothetical protein
VDVDLDLGVDVDLDLGVDVDLDWDALMIGTSSRAS